MVSVNMVKILQKFYKKIDTDDDLSSNKPLNLHMLTIIVRFVNGKERLIEKARDKYRDLFEEEKNKKREYGRNMSKKEK